MEQKKARNAIPEMQPMKGGPESIDEEYLPLLTKSSKMQVDPSQGVS